MTLVVLLISADQGFANGIVDKALKNEIIVVALLILR